MTIETLMTALTEVFIPLDATVLEGSQKWAKGRVAALETFQKSDEAKALRKGVNGTWNYYDRLFNIAGGKTWYHVFHNNSDAGIEAFIVKNCKTTAEKRNASIAKKLTKAQVTEVVSSDVAHSNDGFNGTFIVETNNGRKKIKIETIVAGGYNIQCLHLRVLVNIKG